MGWDGMGWDGMGLPLRRMGVEWFGVEKVRIIGYLGSYLSPHEFHFFRAAEASYCTVPS